MKNNLIVLSLGALLASCTGGVTVEKAKIENAKDSASYIVGLDYGVGISQQMETFPGGMATETFLKAFVEAFQGKEAKITVENGQQYVADYIEEVNILLEDTTKTESDLVNKDSVSYVIGADYGSGIAGQIESFPGGMNTVAFLDAFVSGFNGDSAKFKVKLEEPREYFMNYLTVVEKEEAAKAEAEAAELAKTDSVAIAGRAFLEANAKAEGVVTTASGLQYKVITEGKGATPTAESAVKVHYHGTLIDGTVFDSSVDRGEPASFGVTQVIAGWTEALQLMSVGSKYILYIPYELAYGSNGAGSIPPFSALVFEVELLEILN